MTQKISKKAAKEIVVFVMQSWKDKLSDNAQYNLGLCHEKGQGVPLNKEKAFELFYSSAVKGMKESQYRVGWAFAEANDWKKACEWWQKSADAGYSIAQYSMGMNYLQGRGVPRNDNKGFELLSAAARQEQKEASDELRKRGRPIR